jgi:hypothetical protein
MRTNHRADYAIKTRIEILVLIITILSFCGCRNNSTEPLPITTSNYMPLNVGDVRQLVYPADSATVLMKVIGKLSRKDGAEVFAMEWTTGIQKPDTQYYMIKDGFYTATELDSDSHAPNPFWEQRLAKLHPVNGETWKHTLGSSDSTFFTASYYQEVQTFCRKFTNVYGFILMETRAGNTDTIMTPFYAESIGFIGTGLNGDLQLFASASYIKVANQEYGSLWPAKNPRPMQLAKVNISNKLRNQTIVMYSLLGAKSTN